MGGQDDVNGVVDRFRIYNNSGNITIHNIEFGNENIGNNMTKKKYII